MRVNTDESSSKIELAIGGAAAGFAVGVGLMFFGYSVIDAFGHTNMGEAGLGVAPMFAVAGAIWKAT